MKQVLRTELINKRANIPAEEKLVWDNQILANLEKVLDNLNYSSIVFYSPIKNEPNLLELATRLHNLGKTIALPKAVTEKHPLEFNTWDLENTSLAEDIYGISCAIGDAIVPDVIIMPVVGYSMHGYRLGYGGGYYDITLDSYKDSKHIITMGVAYSLQHIDCFPTEPHDIALDYIINENEVRKST